MPSTYVNVIDPWVLLSKAKQAEQADARAFAAYGVAWLRFLEL